MSEPPNEMLARMRAHAGTAYILALGAEVTLAEPGKSTMRLPYSEKIVGNPDTGVVHGGVITGLLDHACGMAVGSALGAVILGSRGGATITSYATLDLRIDYMKAARPGADILVAAECVKITRQIVFARGCAYQDSVDDPIAMATGTFIMTEQRPGS